MNRLEKAREFRKRIDANNAELREAIEMAENLPDTIKVEGLYIGYPKSQNMCAETWNGSYFTGSLPFKGISVEFTTISPLTNQAGKYIPIGSMTLDGSKNIMMYNGDNWLKLN